MKTAAIFLAALLLAGCSALTPEPGEQTVRVLGQDVPCRTVTAACDIAFQQRQEAAQAAAQGAEASILPVLIAIGEKGGEIIYAKAEEICEAAKGQCAGPALGD